MIPALVSWSITVLVVMVLLTFVLEIVSLRALPVQERPKTATYDRFGELIGMMENPDYHENLAEAKEDESEQRREAS